MIAEYKRDMNHSYLILTGEKEIDTTTYPVRMLLGNTVPALLKCHLQGLDGKSLLYYEITSRQSLASFYENRFLGTEDLRFILGCMIQTMEKLEEYLLDPYQLILDPDYIFLDLEKKELRFCYFPGYDKPVDEQFRMLVEYLLPKLDHGDPQAVALGYGLYRKALEEHFQLEHIRKELYMEREEENVQKEETFSSDTEIPEEDRTAWPVREVRKTGEDLWEKEPPKVKKKTVPENKEKMQKKTACKKNRDMENKKRTQILVSLSGCAMAVATILVFLMAVQFGYLPQVRVEKILMGILTGFSVGIGVYLIVSSLIYRKRKEELPDEKQKPADRYRELEEKDIWDQEFQASSDEKKTADQKQPVNDKPQTAAGKSMFRKGNAWKEEAGDYHETVILSMGKTEGPATLVSREPGELATIYLNEELTVIGKMKTAADAVIPLPTVSRLHAKIRKKDDAYYLMDLNSRNGTAVNGRMLHSEEEYQLQDEDEVDFAQARYIFLK